MSRSITSRSITSRIATVAAVAGSAAVAVTLAAGPASAAQANTVVLNPGQSVCVQQYANYQVRGDGNATGGGARFKLLRNGQVLLASPDRVSGWAAELRTSYGNFPGPGYYATCAYNTGTARTTVFLEILTDGEI
jgi:hypothetical protein